MQAGALKRDTGTISRLDEHPRTRGDARRTGSHDLNGAVNLSPEARNPHDSRPERVGRRRKQRRRRHRHLEGRARDRPVRRDRREGAGWPCGPRKPVVARYEGFLTVRNWAEPDGAVREGAPLRRSGQDERDDHESNPPAHRPGLLVTVVLAATSGAAFPPARGDGSSALPRVERVARELRTGAKSVIVFVFAGTTERNPGVLVRLPIGGATGRAGRQAPRAPCVGSPRAALRSRAASSAMRGHPSIPSRRRPRPSSAPPRAGRA